MKGYDSAALTDVLRSVGIKDGDILYVSTQLFGLGPMEGAGTRADLVTGFYRGLRDTIGPGGTIVVPTFTQQVGRFGVPYVHETTESLTGIFGEFVRGLPEARRSLHPVFSVTAIGPRAADITHDVSRVAFGKDSAFDRLYRLGGQAVCAGFDFYSGHITSLMHYVETTYAVPYYYNKYVLADVWSGGRQVDAPFVINVKYATAGRSFDYRRYIDALAAAGEIRSAGLGSGTIHAVDIKRQIDIGFGLLKEDIHAFLSGPPAFAAGTLPLDGPPEKGKSPDKANWAGFLIGV